LKHDLWVQIKVWLPGLPDGVFKFASFLDSMKSNMDFPLIIGIKGTPFVEHKCGDGICQDEELKEQMDALGKEMLGTTCLQDCPVNGFCDPGNDTFAAEYHMRTGKVRMGPDLFILTPVCMCCSTGRCRMRTP
jgi:hypothetical protein